jgi:hypothetical protein
MGFVVMMMLMVIFPIVIADYTEQTPMVVALSYCSMSVTPDSNIHFYSMLKFDG